MLAAVPAAAGPSHPLTYSVRTEDARRFAALFEASAGKPTAEELQKEYLDGAGRGVAVFTPYRIRDSHNLASAIARDPEKYRRGIEVCLPLAEEATSDLQSIYLALAGLFPDATLPEIHVVFGAGNSGGTAAPGIQVLGLEVICEIAESPEAVRATFRQFFAHETVHTLQPDLAEGTYRRDPLLTQALREGFADYVAAVVTGAPPTPERHSWAIAREAELWRQFEADRRLLREANWDGSDLASLSPAARAAFFRWFANYDSAPDGWPHEAGYWIGRRICEAYMAQADDKQAALGLLLKADDPAAILARSGYGD